MTGGRCLQRPRQQLLRPRRFLSANLGFDEGLCRVSGAQLDEPL
jgi:hypothetical protein